jgi:hypothetical protein
MADPEDAKAVGAELEQSLALVNGAVKDLHESLARAMEALKCLGDVRADLLARIAQLHSATELRN